MNFTSQIKKELINKKMNSNGISAFISGAFFTNEVANENEISLKILNNELYEYLISILKKSKFKYSLSKNGSIMITKKQLLDIESKYATYYFAGIFLSSGSISNLDSSSYHLEIYFKSEANCNKILEFAKKHIIFSKIKNKNNYVLYLKKNEAISDFLVIIGAQKSYLNFVDSIIERDLKNQITRIFNLDIHNQNRLVDSNVLFKENYQYIKNNKLESNFSSLQLEFYEFKLKNEFLSLSQLSEEFSKLKRINKTKSCLNHWLIKLRNVCDENK